MLQIDFALRGIDPTTEGNEFVVKMTPVSALDEIQRSDLYDARLRAMEGLTRLVMDLEGLNRKAWFKFLLEKFGGFRQGFFDKFVDEAKADADKGVQGAGQFGLVGASLSPKEQKFLLEAIPPGMGDFIHSTVAAGTPSSLVCDKLPRLGGTAA